MPIHKSRFRDMDSGDRTAATGSRLLQRKSRNRPGDSQKKQPVPTVEIVEAKRGSLPIHEQLTGNAKALNQTGIYPEITGRIVEVLANNGDRVKRGHPCPFAR